MEALNKQDSEESAIDIGSRTARVTSYVLLSKVFSFLFVGIAFILITRILGPTGYGIYILATAVAGVFGSVGNFGIATSLNRFIAKYKNSEAKQGAVLSDGFIILLIIGGILTAVAFLASGVIASVYSAGGLFVGVFRLISFTIILSMMFGAAYSALIGLGRGAHAAASIVTESGFQAVVGVSLALLGFGPKAPVFGLIAGYSAGLIVGILLIFKSGIKPSFPSLKRIKDLFSFSLPIAISNTLGAAVSSIALLVLGLFASTFVVGNFGIASRANFLFDIVLGSIGISLLPTFTAALQNRATKHRTGEFYSYSVYMAFVLVAPMIFFVATFAKPFSYTAFSSEYSLAPLYIAVTSIGLLIGIAGSYASTLLISAGQVRKVMKYNAIIAVIELALMAVVVPEFKGIGLVVLLFVVNPLLVDFFFIRRSIAVFKARLGWRKITRVLLANIVTSLLLYAVALGLGLSYEAIIIFGIVGFIFIYPIMLGLVKGIGKSDITLLKRVSNGIPIVGIVVEKLLNYTNFFMR